MRARRLTTAFLVLVVLQSLVFAWPAMAQTPEPQEPVPSPTSPSVAPPEPRLAGWPGESGELDPMARGELFARSKLAGVAGPQAAAAPDVNLGQPGLSFRYDRTFGVTEEAYQADGQHLNAPSGLFIDGNDNLYVVEDHGYRLLRFNPAGANSLAVGTAGLCIESNSPTRFCVPQDVAVDGGGNIWVGTGDRVVQLNPGGSYQQQLPVPSSSGTWSYGNDNTHFDGVTGVALDNGAGRMFVSDGYNHRVQVYTFSDGAPMYSGTIGVTGNPGSDNSHFDQPGHLAVDSGGHLYVADTGNNRVQRCSFSGTWSCTTFGGGAGVSSPQGISVDQAGNVYIHDQGNGRVVKCDSGGSCSSLVTGMLYSRDVAVDSGGNVYAGAYGHGVIRKYNSAGGFIGDFVGTNDQAFVPDALHIYSPWGIAVAADGSIYVAERFGYRLLKFDASGAQKWAIGRPGSWGGDNTYLNSLEGKPAVAANGNVYLPDTGNNRIQVFSPSGAYVATFGSYGTGNDNLNWPNGVAINAANGDIYVADQDNHRVQVYDSNFGYKATLGVTGASGSDAAHFNGPRDVAVDASGNVFVADSNNQRVQKCTLDGSSGSCTTFAGVTGASGSDFAHFGRPLGVTVDNIGRVYVVEEWNNRVQVFDSSGAYLTTLGGNWGRGTGQLRSPSGVALDSMGNVYIADRENHRVQKFAPGVPGWKQVNINGFGQRENSLISALTSFSGNLYAGTYNWSGNGAQLWRKSSDGNWTAIMQNGFGDATNVGVDHLAEFKGNFYAGTWNGNNSPPLYTTGGQLWRSSNGSDWTRVVNQGFGDPTNGEVFHLGVFKDTLYATTWSYTNTHGSEMWRSASGNDGSWQRVVTNGFGNAHSYLIGVMAEYGGYLYAGTMRYPLGGQVWRSLDGATWNQVNADGFGSADNYGVWGLVPFHGYLYAGTTNRNAATGVYNGGQVWRCADCDGSDWQQVISSGFGDTGNRYVYSLVVFNDRLYAVTYNWTTGTEVWRTSDGDSWNQVNPDGFGDSNVGGTYFGNSVTVFDNHLFIGTNGAVGGRVWVRAVTADFTATPTRGRPPLNVTFTNTSSGDYTTSLWDFGDGATSTEANPTHNYTASGKYTVSLTVGDGVESDTLTRTAYIDVHYFTFLPRAMRNYDPSLYDDFNNPVYDGSYNPAKWTLDGDMGVFQARQETGRMLFTSSGSASASSINAHTRPAQRSWAQVQVFEAKMGISSDRSGDQSSIRIKFRSEYINGHPWETACVLFGAPSMSTVGSHCYIQGVLVNEYDVFGPATNYGTLNTVRIEANPTTAELRFYLNGSLIGSHVPDDAAALLSATNLDACIRVKNDPNSTSTRYVDDVRITPAQ